MLDFLFANGNYREPPGCKIRINRVETKDLYRYVTEVTVDAARDRATTAKITLTAPAEADGGWVVQDHDSLTIGNDIVVDAVFGTQEETVFGGYIASISASYPIDRGLTQVVVECQDETLKLDQTHTRIAWKDPNDLSDGIIVTKIVNAQGVKPHPENQNGITSAKIVQSESDIQFLRKRARANGYELYARDRKIYFGPMRLNGEPQSPIFVYAGRKTNCLSFNVTNNVHHPDSVSYDIASEDSNTVQTETLKPSLKQLGKNPAKASRAPIGNSDWYLARTQTPSSPEAMAYAQGIVDSESMRVKAAGELDGTLYGHVLRVGEPVSVQGAADENNGRYYVDTVTHTITSESYKQAFALFRNGIGDDVTNTQPVLAAVMGV